MIASLLPHAPVSAIPSALALLSGELWQVVSADSKALAWFGFLQVAFILAAWIAARALVPKRELNSFGQYDRREGAGLGKALGLYFTYLILFSLGLFGLRLGGAPFQLGLLNALLSPATAGPKWIAILAGIGMLSLAIAVVLPMGIFRIRLGRAVSLLALILVITSSAGWVIDRMMGKPFEGRLAALREWSGYRGEGGVLRSIGQQTKEDVTFGASEKTGQDRTKPMADRTAAVKSMYYQLEEIRATLPPGDDRAISDYNVKKGRYENLLRALREEIAAQPQAPAPPQ